MRTKWLIGLMITAGVFSSWAWADEVLISDAFTNNTGIDQAVTNYNFAGQSGSLAPLTYSVSTNTPTTRSNLVTTAGKLLLCGKINASSAVGFSQNIEINKMRIEWDMNILSGGALTSAWAAVTIGNTNSVSQAGTSLFQVRLLEAGLVQVATNGTAGTISFANEANLAGSMTSFRIEFNNTAWDGSGTATVDLYVNKGSGWTQLDLNGTATGLSLSRAGFTDNYISLSTQLNNSNTAWNGVEFDNLAITQVSSVLSTATAQLPFSETFDALTLGSIDAQNGWTNLSGKADIQSAVFVSSSQALILQTGMVTRAISSGGTSLWASFQARITAAPDTDPVVTNANTRVAFFINTNLNIVVYSNQTPVRLNFIIQTNTWSRFDIFCDYTTLRWLLSVNGTNVAENLGFYSASSRIESLLIANDSHNPEYFDDLAVLDTEPAGVVVDTDKDGMPDWWEQRYFGGVTSVSPGMAASNGMNCLQAYIAGLNPADENDRLTLLNQTNRCKFNWARKPDRQYDVYWTSNLTAGFTYIQTATTNEFEDTDAGRTGKSSGFYQIRVHR